MEVDSTSLEKKRLQSRVVPLKKKLNEKSIKFENFIINESSINFKINENDFKNFEQIINKKSSNEINTFLDQYNSFELEYFKNKMKLRFIYLSMGL